MVMQNRSQSVIAAERRIKAYELRKGGLTYEEISRATGVSTKQAYDDVKRILREGLESRKDELDEMRKLELDRIDRIWNRVYAKFVAPPDEAPHVTEDDRLKYANALIRLSKRRSELTGMDMPVKVAPTTPDGMESLGYGPICLAPLEEVSGNGEK